jgi:hypothetical protein
MQTAAPSLDEFLAGLAKAPAILAKATSYAPYIAGVLMDALKARDPNSIITDCGNVQYDLHERGGYSLSTSKFLEVEDRNGNRYRVTVEDIHAANEKPLTARQREMIRDALSLSFGNDPDAKPLIERFRERR